MAYIGRDRFYEEPLARPSAMATDLYELTMAQALFLEGTHEQIATFHAFVRKNPYNGAYIVTAGQNIVFEWLDKNWKFTDRDIARLKAKKIPDPKTGEKTPVFQSEFLEMLKNAEIELTVDAMPEGEIAFPSEPIYRVSGPLWQCLAVETFLLNIMNSQSNFATYASILKNASDGKPVAEFGARRSQDVGGLSPTRGAYVGGIDSTSNCWAESNYGIPTIGTMAHAYVMVHETEIDAYMNWAKHNPHLGIFLPDTYEPNEGMKKVIEACKQTGTKLLGFRQDSGDLGYLAERGQKFAEAEEWELSKNAVSGDLNASKIAELESKYGESIDVYAVGTKLTTCADQPALGGVYKVGNIYEKDMSNEDIIALKEQVRNGEIHPSEVRDKVRDIMKLSNDPIKMTFPGELDLIRYLEERKDGRLYFDGGTICPEWATDPLKFDDPEDPFSGRLAQDVISVPRDNPLLPKCFNKGNRAYRPLKRFFDRGRLVADIETVHEARERALERLAMLDSSHKQMNDPHPHIVGVEESLVQRRDAMGRRLKATGNTVEANKI